MHLPVTGVRRSLAARRSLARLRCNYSDLASPLARHDARAVRLRQGPIATNCDNFPQKILPPADRYLTLVSDCEASRASVGLAGAPVRRREREAGKPEAGRDHATDQRVALGTGKRRGRLPFVRA